MEDNSQRFELFIDHEVLGDVIVNALRSRRHIIAHALARELYGRLQDPLAVHEARSLWIPIESLSQLRTKVGGRFQNLKERWLGAGFPLREAKGERSGRAQLDNEGWERLVHWLKKQGFAARLPLDAPPEVLFEIAPLPEFR